MSNKSLLPSLGVLSLLMAACGGDPGVGSEESDLTMGSSRTRTLAEPVAVPTDNDIGRSIEDVKAALIAGAQPYDERDVPWGDGVCHLANYQVEGYRYVNWEDCPGEGKHILRAYAVGGGNLPELVWADHDYDGRVDSWSDDDVDGFGHSLYDDNKDGRVDRETIDVELVAELDLDAYVGCTPPEYLAKRILEDTNFDGHFETESLTAGRGPDGSWAYWLCE